MGSSPITSTKMQHWCLTVSISVFQIEGASSNLVCCSITNSENKITQITKKKVRINKMNMNMIANVGDKFVVTNKIIGFLNEGDIVEVTNVGENNMISFMFTGENYECEGSMSLSEFEKCFEKVIEKHDETNNADVNAIIMEQIEEIMEHSEIEAYTAFDKCAVVSCKLPNGFVIVESSSCVGPYEYDEEYNIDVCLDKIADKIFELEAYRLQNELYLAEMAECHCDCCSCESCNENCCDEDDEDECLDTDLDCDDCTDWTCDFNPRYSKNIKH